MKKTQKLKKISQKRLEELSDLLSSAINAKWTDFDAKIKLFMSSSSEDEVKTMLSDKIVYSNIIEYPLSSASHGRWRQGQILSQLIADNYSLGDFLLENSDIDAVKTTVLELGMYSNISLLDKVVRGEDGQAKEIAAQWCSIKALRELKGSKSKRVQEIYYERLGPVECLDEMLSAKYASIRAQGLARAPMNYHKLKEMTNEIARQPFSILVRKIPFEYLPMLLANRNVAKNQWMRNQLEERLNRGK
tara:strand:+ start:2382 stop:3122 length:741 start_codon:yes stop_codon:yes gene_type:complete